MVLPLFFDKLYKDLVVGGKTVPAPGKGHGDPGLGGLEHEASIGLI